MGKNKNAQHQNKLLWSVQTSKINPEGPCGPIQKKSWSSCSWGSPLHSAIKNFVKIQVSKSDLLFGHSEYTKLNKLNQRRNILECRGIIQSPACLEDRACIRGVASTPKLPAFWDSSEPRSLKFSYVGNIQSQMQEAIQITDP